MSSAWTARQRRNEHTSQRGYNLTRLVAARELAGTVPPPARGPLRTAQALAMPGRMKQCEIDLGAINKVFASEWLSSDEIIIGTKCNKLMVLDVNRGKQFHIQSLEATRPNYPRILPHTAAGIHTIAVNPSRTILGTGGHFVNDIALYRLPSMEPLCVGGSAHDDWIFDSAWLDDEVVVSGGRDGRLCFWKVNEAELRAGSSECGGDQVVIPSISPLEKMRCTGATNDRIRALSYNIATRELATLMIKSDYRNASWHLLDANTLKKKRSFVLPFSIENVCMGLMTSHDLYAVGSKSNVCFIDARSPNSVVQSVPLFHRGTGVRSFEFFGPMCVVGTGSGRIAFYDVRTFRPLVCPCSPTGFSLLAGRGWNPFADAADPLLPRHAIYTMKFDRHGPSGQGQRLFAAGGPLPASFYGNYAAIFQ